jgi:hypothetical protein
MAERTCSVCGKSIGLLDSWARGLGDDQNVYCSSCFEAKYVPNEPSALPELPVVSQSSSGPRGWYLSRGGQQTGPVAFSDIQNRAATGRIFHNDLLWTEGMKNWVSAGSVAGLIAAGSNSGQRLTPSIPRAVTTTRPIALKSIWSLIFASLLLSLAGIVSLLSVPWPFNMIVPGTVFALISIFAVGIAFYLGVGQRFACPACGTTETRAISARTGFQIRAPRECCACGDVWEPPSPKWLVRVIWAISSMAALLGAVIALAGFFWGEIDTVVSGVFITIVGLAGASECVRRAKAQNGAGTRISFLGWILIIIGVALAIIGFARTGVDLGNPSLCVIVGSACILGGCLCCFSRIWRGRPSASFQ